MSTERGPLADRLADIGVRVVLRTFQVVAVAEGGLLPAILIAAVVYWTTGWGRAVVAAVGATHGTAFMVYMLLAPLVARLLRWPWRMLSVAVSVAFVPLAPWSFERRIRAELTACSVASLAGSAQAPRQP